MVTDEQRKSDNGALGNDGSSSCSSSCGNTCSDSSAWPPPPTFSSQQQVRCEASTAKRMEALRARTKAKEAAANNRPDEEANVCTDRDSLPPPPAEPCSSSPCEALDKGACVHKRRILSKTASIIDDSEFASRANAEDATDGPPAMHSPAEARASRPTGQRRRLLAKTTPSASLYWDFLPRIHLHACSC